MTAMPAGQYPQPQPQQPATVVLVSQAPKRPPVVSGYLRCQSIAVGVFLMIVGALSVVFNIVGIVITVDKLALFTFSYRNSVALACHGVWAGILVRIYD